MEKKFINWQIIDCHSESKKNLTNDRWVEEKKTEKKMDKY